MVFTADCGPRPENAVRYTSAYGGPPHYQWHGFSGPKGGCRKYHIEMGRPAQASTLWNA